MLFNSYEFIFAFLPITLIGYYLIGRWRWRTLALAWLSLMSIVFYAWWDFHYVPLLVASITFNFFCGRAITQLNRGDKSSRTCKFILIGGIVGNFGLLGFYKYSNFFLQTWAQITDGNAINLALVLPLGISFFTFTQIAYLIDAYRNETCEPHYLHYFLFVTFFPHLIAGPIVHHKDILPTFIKNARLRLSQEDFAIGISIFLIGLSKKVLLADSIEGQASNLFDLAAAGRDLSFFEAWVAALSYTFQIYFDFSGYSDMAVGLARLFGISFPMNFFSPYKAISISEFWQRWHMSLSRFLRDYLYIPLGGNRRGLKWRYVNLMITMILGGFWHGAGWTFIVWGALHGLYLVLQHAWTALIRIRLPQPIACGITFVAVVIGWVFFRASDFTCALSVLKGMIGIHGVSVHPVLRQIEGLDQVGFQFNGFLPMTGRFTHAIGWILLHGMIVWKLPNSMELFGNYRPALQYETFGREFNNGLNWRPKLSWALAIVLLSIVSIVLVSRAAVFIYYQF